MKRTKKDEIRLRAENDLVFFINLVAPYRLLGGVHKEVIKWWENPKRKSHQLLLLPRDHMKSALIALRVAQYLAKHPDARVLYISSTSNLAEKQLKFIKDILNSKTFRLYWPEHLHPDESKREKWTEGEISLDHPLRKQEGIRDPSIFTAGLTTNITGLHCDIAVLDDVVTAENAYTKEGRNKVKLQYSLLASIESAEAEEWTVGTVYHPNDLYHELQQMKIETFDDEGNIVDEDPVYEVFRRVVEDKGDGTGEFLWPRSMRSDGRWFGFDEKILAKKRAQYLDKTQFRAQYYNDPNSRDEGGIKSDYFQYYDRSKLTRQGNKWFIGNRQMTVVASMDLSFTKGLKSDYTAIVVLGVTSDFDYYVLDIERFKTDVIKDYFTRLLSLHDKWQFRIVRCDAVSAQIAIVNAFREEIKRWNRSLKIEEYKVHRHLGSKEERMYAILQPRYENLQVYHYEGGNCQVLEDELVLENPPFDDVKDALSSALSLAEGKAPSDFSSRIYGEANIIDLKSHSRFGGIF